MRTVLFPAPNKAYCCASTQVGNQCKRKPRFLAIDDLRLCRYHITHYDKPVPNAINAYLSKPIEPDDDTDIIRDKINHTVERLSKNFLRPSVNDDDFLTMSPLSDFPEDEYMISYADEDNKVWTFVIVSIKSLIDNMKAINPYTQQPIPSRVIKDILSLDEISKHAPALLHKPAPIPIEAPKPTLHSICVDLCRTIDNLDHFTDIDWFISLDIIHLAKFYKELRDIWEYRANLTDDMKRAHVIDGKLFANPELASNNISNLTKTSLSMTIFNECKRLCTEGRTRHENSLGALWILTALTLVNKNARNAMPWLYESAI